MPRISWPLFQIHYMVMKPSSAAHGHWNFSLENWQSKNLLHRFQNVHHYIQFSLESWQSKTWPYRFQDDHHHIQFSLESWQSKTWPYRFQDVHDYISVVGMQNALVALGLAELYKVSLELHVRRWGDHVGQSERPDLQTRLSQAQDGREVIWKM